MKQLQLVAIFKLSQECSRDQHNATGADTAAKPRRKRKKNKKKKNGKNVEVNATDEHSDNGSNNYSCSDNDID